MTSRERRRERRTPRCAGVSHPAARRAAGPRKERRSKVGSARRPISERLSAADAAIIRPFSRKGVRRQNLATLRRFHDDAPPFIASSSSCTASTQASRPRRRDAYIEIPPFDTMSTKSTSLPGTSGRRRSAAPRSRRRYTASSRLLCAGASRRCHPGSKPRRRPARPLRD